jgi:hypothetical protein
MLEAGLVELERHYASWSASIDLGNGGYPFSTGPSQLAAGMRAILSYKYGEKVPDEQYKHE